MSSDAKDEPEREGVLDDSDGNGMGREWEQESAKSRGGSLGWILVVAIVGVAIGIMVAPKPGQETREQLSRKAKQFRHQVEEVA